MNETNFWTWFDGVVRPHLKHRADTFAAMFQYLDQMEKPVTIVETGCMRSEPSIDAFRCDGCSTLLFDQYVTLRKHNGFVYSVNNDLEAVMMAKRHTGVRTDVVHLDSVDHLTSLSRVPNFKIDLLYLDSYDLDWDDPIPAAMHHYRELMAAKPMLFRDTLIVVDDSPASMEITGKGMIVGKQMSISKSKLAFCQYQTGWINMGGVE